MKKRKSKCMTLLSALAFVMLVGCNACALSNSSMSSNALIGGNIPADSTPMDDLSSESTPNDSTPEANENELKPIQPGGNYDVGSGY